MMGTAYPDGERRHANLSQVCVKILPLLYLQVSASVLCSSACADADRLQGTETASDNKHHNLDFPSRPQYV